MKVPTEMSMAELDVGQPGEVTRVAGEDAITIRLLEMGFVPGTRVRLVKRAPFGDPLEFQVRGYHISIRAAEAARVEISLSK